MLHLTISLRALVFILLFLAAALTGSDVAQGAPAASELTGSDGVLMTNPGQNGARDVHTDSTSTSGNNLGGVRIYAGNTLTNPPTTAALQFFGNGHTVFPGQAFIDSGANNNAAIIFRTAQNGQGVGERMRITANGNVGIGTTTPDALLVVGDGTGSAIVGQSGFGIGVSASANPAGLALRASNRDGTAAEFLGKVDVVGKMRISEAINDVATPTNHIAFINNLANGNSADVLALKIGFTGTPATSNNFITFFKGDDTSVGSLEGNGAGSVQLTGAGGDYAEWLPKRITTEDIQPGDIVGVVDGHISRDTRNAMQVMVASSGAIVAGNDPGEDLRSGYGLVAFVGQAPTRVRGAAQTGDFIVASGDGDGIGIAVAPESMTAEQVRLIVGQAWQGSDNDGVKLINVAVGLERNPAIGRLITSNQEHAARIATLEARLAAIEQRLNGSTTTLVAAR